ncbi:hypothetical protein [Streptomyces sp. OK228]|jgi:hypothetical protein|uniref:hypothetical protein n=1 Tax=Streptomyces sp. OK228 TaxID=1882786 RepID=UPI000BDA25CA|nr:hypothetical protein [Streptomyces sp. OK228]SOE31861.1 hypothetical protein SAMN05442782_8797 [Streptomyces sp. OK228]
MADDAYQFCKIYLRSAELPEVMAMLAKLLEGKFQRRSMQLTELTLDVVKNPDAGMIDDFVCWPTFVELEADDGATNEWITGIAARIITAMWDAGIPAVAACSFEDQLPWCGGIARLNP